MFAFAQLGRSGGSGGSGGNGVPDVGMTAPTLAGKGLDGSTVSLEAYRGHPVILNFWASWCVPCKEEFPLFKQALAGHEKDGLVILGVLFKDDPSSAGAFVASEGASWASMTDPDGSRAAAYRIVAPPQTYFIDRDGVIRARQIGQVRDAAELEQLIATIDG